MELKPFRGSWSDEDPHANFKADVACHSVVDPLPTFENLSKGTGIPLECLVRYVLVKYAASGSDAVLSMEPLVFRQMREHIEKAERSGEDGERLKAYAALRGMISWLSMGPAAGED